MDDYIHEERWSADHFAPHLDTVSLVTGEFSKSRRDEYLLAEALITIGSMNGEIASPKMTIWNLFFGERPFIESLCLAAVIAGECHSEP
jgi:hypothetical protein